MSVLTRTLPDFFSVSGRNPAIFPNLAPAKISAGFPDSAGFVKTADKAPLLDISEVAYNSKLIKDN